MARSLVESRVHKHAFVRSRQTGATIFLNRMALQLCHSVRSGGAAPDEIFVLLLQFLSSWPTRALPSIRMTRRCESPGDANRQAMRIARRCEWQCEASGRNSLLIFYEHQVCLKKSPCSAPACTIFKSTNTWADEQQNRGTILQSQVPRASLCLKLR